jgi:ATP-dependent helicase HrpA
MEDGNVSVRLFPTAEVARSANLPGVQRLIELVVQRDLAWVEKDLRALSRFQDLYAPLGSSEELQAAALQNAKSYILPAVPLPALTEAEFHKAVELARQRLRGLAPHLIDRIGAILQLYNQLLLRSQPAQPKASPQKSFSDLAYRPAAHRDGSPYQSRGNIWMANDLRALAPKNFLQVTPFEQLQDLPRYLKAMLIRAERAGLNPLKDQERQAKLAPYTQLLLRFQAIPKPSPALAQQIAHFRWMIEEFKVSLFAQELGTAFPISPKRLDQEAEAIRQSLPSAAGHH